MDPRDGANRPGAWPDWLESNVYDDIAMLPVGTLDRFHATLVRIDAAGCHTWTGSIDRYGYGYIGLAGRRPSAHRTAYLIAHGSIDPDLVIDHLCRNRACVNPDHLEAVTNAENIARGRNVHQNYCKHGHLIRGDGLIRPNSGVRVCRECNKRRCREYKIRRRERRIA